MASFSIEKYSFGFVDSYFTITAIYYGSQEIRYTAKFFILHMKNV